MSRKFSNVRKMSTDSRISQKNITASMTKTKKSSTHSIAREIPNTKENTLEEVKYSDEKKKEQNQKK